MSPKHDRSKSKPREERGRAIREAKAEDADQPKGRIATLCTARAGRSGSARAKT